MIQHVLVVIIIRKVVIWGPKVQLFVDSLVSIGMQLHHTMLQEKCTRAMVATTTAEILIFLCHGVTQPIQIYPGIFVFNHRILVDVSIRHFNYLAIRIVTPKKPLQ